jgi:hypothetical protein
MTNRSKMSQHGSMKRSPLPTTGYHIDTPGVVGSCAASKGGSCWRDEEYVYGLLGTTYVTES